MTPFLFHTLKLTDKLKAGGFSEHQARAVAEALADALFGGDVATKADLAPLATKVDLHEMEGRFATWLVPLLLVQAASLAALVKLL